MGCCGEVAESVRRGGWIGGRDLSAKGGFGGGGMILAGILEQFGRKL
jgi:hypothetical protein